MPGCITLNKLFKRYFHDDVIKWKHFLSYWPFVRGIHRSPVHFPRKGQWRGALIFSFICAWTNGWANNRDAGDLRRHWVHYDVTVLLCAKAMIVAPGSPSNCGTRIYTMWELFRDLHWIFLALQWRHNGRDGVSNHQPHHCSLYHLVGRRSKKTANLRVTGLCAGNSPVTG